MVGGGLLGVGDGEEPLLPLWPEPVKSALPHATMSIMIAIKGMPIRDFLIYPPQHQKDSTTAFATLESPDSNGLTAYSMPEDSMCYFSRLSSTCDFLSVKIFDTLSKVLTLRDISTNLHLV